MSIYLVRMGGVPIARVDAVNEFAATAIVRSELVMSAEEDTEQTGQIEWLMFKKETDNA